MIDPVMRDLDRHLAKQDEADAWREAEDEILDEWLKNVERVSEALIDLNFEEDFHNIAVEAMISGNASRMLGWLEDYCRQELDEAAAKELDARIEQSKQDEAEARADARDDHY